jgi:hypothetical protein
MTNQADKKSGLRVVVVGGIIFAGLVGVALVVLALSTSTGGKRERTAGAAELALIAPLAPGSALEDYTISAVHPVENGVLRVVCVRDKSRVQLDIALPGSGALAAADAGRYAIFYSLDNAPEAEGQRLAKALAKNIHNEVPTPPGLTQFVPHVPDLGSTSAR